MTLSLDACQPFLYLMKVHQRTHYFVTLLGDHGDLVFDKRKLGHGCIQLQHEFNLACESSEESSHYDRVTERRPEGISSSLLPPVMFAFTASRNPGEWSPFLYRVLVYALASEALPCDSGPLTTSAMIPQDLCVAHSNNTNTYNWAQSRWISAATSLGIS